MCWFQQKYDEITLCGKYISVSIQKANKKVFNEMVKKKKKYGEASVVFSLVLRLIPPPAYIKNS